MPPPAQKSEHPVSILIIARLTQDFCVDHHDRVSAKHEGVVGNFPRYGFGLRLRKPLNISNRLLRFHSRLIDVCRYGFKLPTSRPQYLRAATAPRCQNELL